MCEITTRNLLPVFGDEEGDDGQLVDRSPAGVRTRWKAARSRVTTSLATREARACNRMSASNT